MQDEGPGISWAGFNLKGDRKSIDEVQRLIHLESRLQWFEKSYKDATALTARVERLEAALREIADGGHGHKVCSQIARAALARK